jgi:VIT1/CCC1 family predicted Fe2+/Mn2+ transporter
MKATPHTEPHPSKGNEGQSLNQLRAAVLGANDGITSVAGIVLGVAGATSSKSTIVTAGVAGLLAGAISMAAGEYVSVSSQRDTEKALLDKERYELENYPKEELTELIGLYEAKGLSRETATLVAKELTKHDVFAAHVETELGIDPENLTSPSEAAIASAISFTVGAAIPLTAILLPSESWRVPVTFVAVVIALIITGALSARAGKSNARKAIVRVVAGGVIAMIVTYGIGLFLHAQGI